MTLDDISVSTKIAPRFLVALEEERFDELPGGIFNKGFVRAYARHLGIDENQAIADFVAASTPVVPEIVAEDPPVLAAMAVRLPESKKKRRDNEGIPWEIVAVGLLIIAFGFALWGFYSREKPVPKAAAAVPPSESSSESPKKPVPEPVPAGSPPTAPTRSATPSPSPSAPVPAPVAAAAPGSNSGVFHVLIHAREDSWVSITADGKPILQDTLSAAAEKSIEARDQIVIKSGNVGGLDISFNGKQLAPLGHENQVRTLTFDLNGLRPK